MAMSFPVYFNNFNTLPGIKKKRKTYIIIISTSLRKEGTYIYVYNLEISYKIHIKFISNEYNNYNYTHIYIYIYANKLLSWRC